MKPPRFHYERPESVADTLELLAAEGDRAKVLAGGQSLVALMNLRLASPEIIVDIGRCDDLRFVRANESSIQIGALTTQATVANDASVAQTCPLLAEAVAYIAHAAIRNRGTIGGSIAHADPAAELPLVLTALEGEVTIASSAGSRHVPVADFFQGFLMTAIEPHELLTEVSFPAATPGSGYAFEEFARRPGDFALVSVACRVSGNGDGAGSARVVLGGVGHLPLVVEGLDDLDGAGPDEIVKAAGEAAAAVDAPADIHGTKDYRSHLARKLTERAVERALAQRS